MSTIIIVPISYDAPLLSATWILLTFMHRLYSTFCVKHSLPKQYKDMTYEGITDLLYYIIIVYYCIMLYYFIGCFVFVLFFSGPKIVSSIIL